MTPPFRCTHTRCTFGRRIRQRDLPAPACTSVEPCWPTTAAATQTSVLVVRGVSYRVRVVQPDGTGVCTLLLESPTP